jgi:hypothetical protein
MGMDQPGDFELIEKNKGGRPTKRTPEVVGKLLEAYSRGLSLKNACSFAGVSFQTFQNWQTDSAFVQALEQAKNERKLTLIAKLEAEPMGWQRWAWLAERLAPEEFAKPEVQLNVQNNLIQNNVSAFQEVLCPENVAVLRNLFEQVEKEAAESDAVFQREQQERRARQTIPWD